MKRLVAVLLFLVWVCVGCGSKQVPPETWLDGTGWSAPSFLLLRQGSASVLTQEEYEAELANREEVLLLQTEEASAVTHWNVERRYAPDLALRVTPVYEREAFLGMDALSQITVEKTILKPTGLSSAEQQKIFDAIETRLALQESGQSALTQNAAFCTEEEWTYTALTFVPCVYRITGLLNGNDGVEFEVVYPCVNPAGYLDGVYAVIADDDLNAFGDVS